MTHTSAFKTPEGEAAYLAAYNAAMKLWPVPYEEIEIPSRFGITHVVASGPRDAPPLVLLHGFMVNATMWSPNVADFSKDYRVYAIDVIGQPSKSTPDPDEPIRDTAGLVAWLSETLNGLNLDRISLVGMSFGGWLALNFAMTAPEPVQKLALLSPAACFQPLVGQFIFRMMPMVLFPSRLTVNSLFGWMGFKDTPGDADKQHPTVTRCVLDLAYLGLKHFQMPPESSQIRPSVFSDDELRALHVPVLLLIGEHEVIYDPAKALARARQLIPDFRGELVPQCNHDMCVSQHQIVDARVLDFLDDN
jgi:pimeloyl-ACP methyl ester carboxylesterase